MPKNRKILIRFKVQYSPIAAYQIGRRHGWFSLWFDDFNDASAVYDGLNKQTNVVKLDVGLFPQNKIKNRLSYYAYLLRSGLG